jgi:hypothetical protein
LGPHHVLPISADICHEVEFMGGFGAARVLLAGVDVVAHLVNDIALASTYLTLSCKRCKRRDRHAAARLETDRRMM